MCCGCWNRDGAHQIDNEKVRDAVRLIERVYEFESLGGCLHVYLDDNNLDDKFFDTETLEHVAGREHALGSWQAESECYAALRAMTFAERIAAIGLFDGCWEARDA